MVDNVIRPLFIGGTRQPAHVPAALLAPRRPQASTASSACSSRPVIVATLLVVRRHLPRAVRHRRRAGAASCRRVDGAAQPRAPERCRGGGWPPRRRRSRAGPRPPGWISRKAADALPRRHAGRRRIGLGFQYAITCRCARDHQLLREALDASRAPPRTRRCTDCAATAAACRSSSACGPSRPASAATSASRYCRAAVASGRGDEARADDRTLRAERERGDDAAPVDDATRRHHRDLHRVDDLRHERQRPDLAGVPARLGALRRDDVGARPPRRARRAAPCRSSP